MAFIIVRKAFSCRANMFSDWRWERPVVQSRWQTVPHCWPIECETLLVNFWQVDSIPLVNADYLYITNQQEALLHSCVYMCLSVLIWHSLLAQSFRRTELARRSLHHLALLSGTHFPEKYLEALHWEFVQVAQLSQGGLVMAKSRRL